MADYDVIIIGGNCPALTTAAYLGKEAGLKTLVLERSNFLGASAISNDSDVPGFIFHPAATGEFGIHPQIEADLGLLRDGHVERIKSDPKLTSLFDDGNHFTFYNDHKETAKEIAKFSQKDYEAFWPFVEKWGKLGYFMGMALANPPVPFSQMVATMSASTEMEEMLRDLLFGTITRQLGLHFENEKVKAAFLPFMEGSYTGPSTAPFFFPIGRFLAEWGIVKGGIGNVAIALTNIAEKYGAEIRTNSEVVKILVKNNKAYGIKLANGEEITATKILSELEPGKTFFDLIGLEHTPSEMVRRINEIPYTCMGCTLNLALSGLPDFRIPEEKYGGFIGFAPSFEYAEKAFYEATIGKIPELPLSIGYIPSYVDPSYAPPGQHVLTCMVHPMPGPRDLKNMTWVEGKEILLDNWVESLARFSPNLKQLIVGRGGMSPLELEQNFGMTNGDNEHGDIRWHNELSWRPMVGYGKNRTPIDGLYLGGAQVSSGDYIGGAGGRNAAVIILEDMKLGNLKQANVLKESA